MSPVRTVANGCVNFRHTDAALILTLLLKHQSPILSSAIVKVSVQGTGSSHWIKRIVSSANGNRLQAHCLTSLDWRLLSWSLQHLCLKVCSSKLVSDVVWLSSPKDFLLIVEGVPGTSANGYSQCIPQSDTGNVSHLHRQNIPPTLPPQLMQVLLNKESAGAVSGSCILSTMNC